LVRIVSEENVRKYINLILEQVLGSAQIVLKSFADNVKLFSNVSPMMRPFAQMKRNYRSNRLLFLAPDQGALVRVSDCLRTALAWKSIVDDVEATGRTTACMKPCINVWSCIGFILRLHFRCSSSLYSSLSLRISSSLSGGAENMRP
jgi:hypothetical protein